MVRLFNIMLLWLLMLAVPTQGIAATMMVGCGGSDHEQVQTSKVVAMQAFDDGMDASGADMVSHFEHGHKGDSKNFHGKCSICASCCTGAAAFFPAMLTVPAPIIASVPVHISPEKPFSVIFLDGLERPPHTV